jgi:hypothetical protein
MNVISKLLGLSLFVVGCATGGGAHSLTADAARRPKIVSVEGTAPHPVVSGPATIHAYSSHGGTRLYTAAAVTGTERDCQQGLSQATHSQTRLPSDRVVSFNVPAGQIACADATSPGAHELLWHPTESPSSDGSMLATSAN